VITEHTSVKCQHGLIELIETIVHWEFSALLQRAFALECVTIYRILLFS